MMPRFVAVARTAFRHAVSDDLATEGAAVAFFFFLALFPVVLIVFALTGLVGGDAAFAVITDAAERAVPQYAWQFVRDLIEEITGGRRPGVLSLGILLALWSASNGVAALTRGLNVIYGVSNRRPWWKRQLLAFGVLLGGLLLLVIGVAAFIPTINSVERHGLGNFWRIVRWPVGYCLPSVTIWLAYRFLPARDQRGRSTETAIGALIAGLLWAAATLLFRVYLTHFNSYSKSYGTVGAVIALLLWFYFGSMAVLFGGQIAASLESRDHDAFFPKRRG
jgi:membrane protein